MAFTYDFTTWTLHFIYPVPCEPFDRRKDLALRSGQEGKPFLNGVGGEEIMQ
jgi:hypothetical protein